MQSLVPSTGCHPLFPRLIPKPPAQASEVRSDGLHEGHRGDGDDARGGGRTDDGVGQGPRQAQVRELDLDAGRVGNSIPAGRWSDWLRMAFRRAVCFVGKRHRNTLRSPGAPRTSWGGVRAAFGVGLVWADVRD